MRIAAIILALALSVACVCHPANSMRAGTLPKEDKSETTLFVDSKGAKDKVVPDKHETSMALLEAMNDDPKLFRALLALRRLTHALAHSDIDGTLSIKLKGNESFNRWTAADALLKRWEEGQKVPDGKRHEVKGDTRK